MHSGYLIATEPESDDDFEIVQTPSPEPELDDEEFTVINWFDTTQGAYFPAQINAILQKQFSAKFKFEKALYFADSQTLYARLYTHAERRIVLFNTVKDFQGCGETQLIDLEWVLEKFATTETLSAHDVLIIPVGELMRKHFRLLTIKNHVISYYDSKNLLMNFPVRIANALKASAMATADELELELESFNPGVYASDSWLTVAEKNLTAVKRAASQIGMMKLGLFAVRTGMNASAYFDPVRLICSRVFPNLPFNEIPLGHQAMQDHIHCGTFTAAYAEKVASSESTDNIADPLSLRGRFEDIEDKIEFTAERNFRI